MLPTAPEIVHEHEPENSEPAPRALIDAGFYTPLGPAFRRNHAAFPAPSFVDSWRLTISSAFNDNDPPDNISERELWSGGLDELKARWAGNETNETTLRVALQCAGNRRDELSAVRKTQGIQWNGGTIANHLFSGVLVRELLLSLGIPTGASGSNDRWHVHFESGVGPKEETGSADSWYGCSLPLDWVMGVAPPFSLFQSVETDKATVFKTDLNRQHLISWRTRLKASPCRSNTAHLFGS